MISPIKTKQDLVTRLRENSVRFIGEFEVVNESGLKQVTDKIKMLLRQNKKLHVILLERS